MIERFKNNGIPELKLNALQLSMKAQVEQKIAENTYTFEEVPCAVCNSSDAEPMSDKDRYGLYFQVNICVDCGLLYTSPRMTQASYNQFYNEEYRKLYVGKNSPTDTFFSQQQKKGEKIYRFLSERKLLSGKTLNVLEVGCGAGGIIEYFRQKGHHVKGIDLGESYLDYGRSRHNLDLEVGSLATVNLEEKPDLIIYSHIMEHILDINAEVALVKSIMKEDSILYVEVPGVKEIHKNYEMNMLRYLQNAHTYHFTLETLQNLMNRHGLDLVSGNQFVKSVFKLGDTSTKEKINDYQSVKSYIETTEQNRWKYGLTPSTFKRKWKEKLIQTLDDTGIRKLYKKN